MRPPEFTGGNLHAAPALRRVAPDASMRPPEFTGGNLCELLRQLTAFMEASMRPPEFTGGNPVPAAPAACPAPCRFNEAAGIHRRKPAIGPHDPAPVPLLQ